MYTVSQSPSVLSLSATTQLSRVFYALLAFAMLFVFAVPPTHAQVDLGKITGTVQDTTGASVKNAVVTAKNQATATVRTTNTNEQGIYSFPSLSQGIYEVSVSSVGFGEAISTVEVGTGNTVSQDFRLTVGSTAQQVSVTDSSSRELETESHEVRTAIEAEQLTQLPVSGRNPLEYALLAAGTAAASDPAESTSSAQFFGNTNHSIVLGGATDTQTGYLQDGVENVTLLTQTANILPSVESIRELDVITNGADARFRQPGVINITTKSGTNLFHGTAYDFLQNDALNAFPYNFATVPPVQTPLRYNLFGANLGGPILKDKLFFFVDYSGLRSSNTVVGLYRVPTAAELNGDFSASSKLIYDPSSYNAKTGSNESYLAETGKNAIPGGAAAFDPFAVAYLKFIPAANIPYDPVQNKNFQTALKNTTTSNQYQARGDWAVTQSDQLYASFGYADVPTTNPSFAVGLFGRIYEGKSTNVLAEETHIVNSELVNSARFGFNRSNYFETIQGAGTENYVQALGLKNLNPLPQQWAPPNVNISTYLNAGYPYAPQGAIQNRYQFIDQVSWIIGKHSLSLGGEIIRTQFDGNWVIANNGGYSFDGLFTSQYVKGARSKTAQGNPLADFLLGYPFKATGATGISAGSFRESEVAGFIQDDWKVRSNLTLNMGLRYQFDNPPYDKNGHGSIYDLPSNQTIPGTWNTNYKDFAPRIGFSYSPAPNTVIRGGFGIYYAGSPYNFLQFLLAHAPNFIPQAPSFQITNPTPTEDVFVANPSSAGQVPQTLAKHMPDVNVQEFNLFVEQKLGSVFVGSIGYAGEIGRHESIRLNANQPNAVAPGTTSTKYNERPYAYIGDVFGQYNEGSSNSNGLQATLRGQFKGGSTVLASYTWSRAMDISDGDRYVVSYSYQPSLDYAPSAWDRTQSLSLGSVYMLPFGPNQHWLTSPSPIIRLAAAGWQLSTIWHLGSGLPVSVTATQSADTGSLGQVWAQKVCNPASGFNRTGKLWFNPACFAQTGPFQYGVGGRNGVREPGIDNVSIGLGKSFLITNRQQLQFRAEAFNAFNHPQFSLPGLTSVNNKALGVLTGTSRSMRTMQLALRYSF